MAFGPPRASALAASLAVLSALLGGATAAQDCAINASPEPIAVRQPDGRSIELYLRGSAFRHWHEDAAGFPVLAPEAGRGWFVYARLDAAGVLEPTALRAGIDDPSAAGLAAHVAPLRAIELGQPSGTRGLAAGAPSAPAPAAGTRENLVLLLRFADHGPSGQNRALPSAADMQFVLNTPGGHPVLAPTGSVADHYSQNSYGQFTFDSTPVGWLDLPEDESYYAAGNAGLTELTWELVQDGLELADALVDFADFDADGDGRIDAITILHSGYGAEWGGSDQYGTWYLDRIWSHKWGIPEWTSDEGVGVLEYNLSPGLWGVSGSEAGHIGVICHELGHFLGLPDLYDIDGGGEGCGNWCLMAGGAWGFDGSQRFPSHMGAWAKVALGWIAPVRATPGSYVAAPVETTPSVWRIDSGYPEGEHVLVENRQALGFDAVIPAEGLAIWHVDETKGLLSWNSVNTEEGSPFHLGWPANGAHYRVALLQADGLFDLELGWNRGDSGDLYRAGTATSITGLSSPSLRAYQGGNVLANGNAIQGIAAQGDDVAFTVVNPQTPALTTGALPAATPRMAYAQALSASGGAPPYRWSEYVPDAAYTATDDGPRSFPSGGSAQGWSADQGLWQLDLPFAFPYWETSWPSVWVSSNGYLDFVPTEGTDDYNQSTHLAMCARIAPLWDDLTTEFGDVFVDTSVAGRVLVRWQAHSTAAFGEVNAAVELFADGRFRFHYGAGNAGLTPTVGFSRGTAENCLHVPGLDGAASLANASTWTFERTGSGLPSGLSLAQSGALAGTPATPGSFVFRARATDALEVYGEEILTLAVQGDCDQNGIEDALDLASGAADCNANGVLDVCEAPPEVYCTAKTDSAGCAPAMAFAGAPGGTGAFALTASGVRTGRPGLMLYGFDAAAIPFLGGTLCALPPVRRTPIQFSGGSGGACAGTFAFDFNAWQESGEDPLLAPGQQVNAQYWYRDPQAADGSGSGLSDAVEFQAGC